ncbi:hypothetical protein IHE44_0007982 [Lamprotornis superbus]|uniref:DEP domain-containing protein n=1 Tax=Lamprotornis superbus TaxID=245042 RepID=A0A835TPT3_9PASS|nr:hypothetical protein IHE44_0007982 [Lamprotornis superbus]
MQRPSISVTELGSLSPKSEELLQMLEFTPWMRVHLGTFVYFFFLFFASVCKSVFLFPPNWELRSSFSLISFQSSLWPLFLLELEESPLTVKSDMATIVKVMQLPDSGLEIRDRMWLKITISNAVIGADVVDWLYTHVEGFKDRREARKYASSMLKHGYLRHTVNKITFSEQCYYVFGDLCGNLAALNLNNGSSGASDQDTLAPLPHPAAPWPLGQGYPYQYPLPPPCFPPAYQDPGFSYGSGSAGSQQSEVPWCCLCLSRGFGCSLHGLCATALKSKVFVSLEEWLSVETARLNPVRNSQAGVGVAGNEAISVLMGLEPKCSWLSHQHKRKITFFCKREVASQGFPGLKHCSKGGEPLLACVPGTGREFCMD